MDELFRQLLLAGFLQALSQGKASLSTAGPLLRQLFPAPPVPPPLRYTVTKLWVDGQTVENGAHLWRHLADALVEREGWNAIAERCGHGRPYFVLDKVTGERILQ